MKTVWTSHISDPVEKVKYEKSLKHSRWILDRQLELLSDMERDLDKQETSAATYDKPNWDYRQADNNGYRRCLNSIKALITLDQKDTSK